MEIAVHMESLSNWRDSTAIGSCVGCALILCSLQSMEDQHWVRDQIVFAKPILVLNGGILESSLKMSHVRYLRRHITCLAKPIRILNWPTNAFVNLKQHHTAREQLVLFLVCLILPQTIKRSYAEITLIHVSESFVKKLSEHCITCMQSQRTR